MFPGLEKPIVFFSEKKFLGFRFFLDFNVRRPDTKL